MRVCNSLSFLDRQAQCSQGEIMYSQIPISLLSQSEITLLNEHTDCTLLIVISDSMRLTGFPLSNAKATEMELDNDSYPWLPLVVN